MQFLFLFLFLMIMHSTVKRSDTTEAKLITNVSLRYFGSAVDPRNPSNESTSSSTSSTDGFHVGAGGEVETDGKAAAAGIIVCAIVLSIFILAAITGNILVIVAIVTERSLRRAGNNFLISLAVADALVASLVMTFAAANDLTNRWSFGSIFCDIWQSCDVMCCTASILNICAVSLDRYINIRSPLRYRNLVTQRRTVIVVAVIWTSSALLSFLPIHLGLHRLVRHHNDTHPDAAAAVAMTTEASADVALNISDLLWEGVLANESSSSSSSSVSILSSSSSDDRSLICLLALNPYYACISSAISFYIPCIVMIVIYVRLYRLSQRHRMFIKSVAVINDLNRSRSPVLYLQKTETNDEGQTNATAAAAAAAAAAADEDDEHQRQSEGCIHPVPKTQFLTVDLRRASNPEERRNSRRQNSFPDFHSLHSMSRDSSFFQGTDNYSRRCSEGSHRPSIESNAPGYRRHGDNRTPSDHRSRPLNNSYSSSNRNGPVGPRKESRSPSIMTLKQTDYKAALTIGCIIGIFLFCWAPFFVINVITSIWEDSVSPVAFMFFSWLGYINSCANPIIYGITNAEFRRAFHRILTSACCSRRRHQLETMTSREATSVGRRQTWTENNNYREVRTDDSPISPEEVQ